MITRDKENPWISVIVPIYKVEPYLDKCIRSIVEQSFSSMEIILVDDGSPDHCGEICEKWALLDDRIRVIHKKNGGLSDARNVGIEKSMGTFISFIDSDDYIEPDMMKNLIEAAIRTRAEIAICNFSYEYEKEYLEDGRKVYPKDSYQIKEELLITGREVTAMMNKGKYTFAEVAWNKLYKRELFSNLRYPVGKLHEDEYVFHHLIYPCKNIVCIPYMGYHYLQRNNSIMGEKRDIISLLGAYLERCSYFIEQDEKELCLFHEGYLLSNIKRLQMENQNLSKTYMLKKIYLKIVLKMFCKGWLPVITLGKRLARIIFL